MSRYRIRIKSTAPGPCDTVTIASRVIKPLEWIHVSFSKSLDETFAWARKFADGAERFEIRIDTFEEEPS